MLAEQRHQNLGEAEDAIDAGIGQAAYFVTSWRAVSNEIRASCHKTLQPASEGAGSRIHTDLLHISRTCRILTHAHMDFTVGFHYNGRRPPGHPDKNRKNIPFCNLFVLQQLWPMHARVRAAESRSGTVLALNTFRQPSMFSTKCKVSNGWEPKMKNSIRIQLVAMLICFGAYSANAISFTIDDANFLGTIVDGIPSSPSDEVDYLNALITLSAGATATTILTEDYDRVGSTLAGPFDTAVITDAMRDETETSTPDFGTTAFQYILAKYDGPDGGSLVWYSAAGFTDVTVPATAFSQLFAVSHVSGYNSSVRVPDGGATIALLGLACIGLQGLRRKFRA